MFKKKGKKKNTVKLNYLSDEDEEEENNNKLIKISTKKKKNSNKKLQIIPLLNYNEEEEEEEENEEYEGYNLKEMIKLQKKRKRKDDDVDMKDLKIDTNNNKNKTTNPDEIDVYLSDSEDEDNNVNKVNNNINNNININEAVKVFKDDEIAKIKSRKLYLQNKLQENQQRRTFLQDEEIELDISSSSSSSEEEENINKQLIGIYAKDLIKDEELEKKFEIENGLYEYDLDLKIEQDEEINKWENQIIHEGLMINNDEKIKEIKKEIKDNVIKNEIEEFTKFPKLYQEEEEYYEEEIDERNLLEKMEEISKTFDKIKLEGKKEMEEIEKEIGKMEKKEGELKLQIEEMLEKKF